MSTFKVTITIQSDLTAAGLAQLFAGLASASASATQVFEEQPTLELNREQEVLETESMAPPASASSASSASPTLPAVATIPTPVEVPPPVPSAAQSKNIHWEKQTLRLVDDATIANIVQKIECEELTSANPSISWKGQKHNPKSLHNQCILNALRNAQNRTLSFTSLVAITGILNKERMKTYLREIQKQGLLTTIRS